ncbi:MAG: hypothetical protein V2A74_05820 [bacterium]
MKKVWRSTRLSMTARSEATFPGWASWRTKGINAAASRKGQRRSVLGKRDGDIESV